MELHLKNFNVYSLLALLMLIGGIVFYIIWGIRYNVWADIGIYSITSVLVLAGLIGLIISLSMERTVEE
ncbi:MAG TPA: hypothetical protein VMT57_06700 [Candidatus Thermoplasmatota archaeon]|nr:hypothetical protein [Candidatus Thermoplasmatota archaeon]